MKDKKEEQNESRRLNYKQPFMHHSHVQPFRSSLFLIYCIPFAIKKLASLNTVTDLKHLENTCHSQSHFNLKHVRVLRRLLVDLFISYFREGVSESQLAQVLSIELGQTIEVMTKPHCFNFKEIVAICDHDSFNEFRPANGLLSSL